MRTRSEGGTPPRRTRASVPRLMPVNRVSTTTSPGAAGDRPRREGRRLPGPVIQRARASSIGKPRCDKRLAGRRGGGYMPGQAPIHPSTARAMAQRDRSGPGIAGSETAVFVTCAGRGRQTAAAGATRERNTRDEYHLRGLRPRRAAPRRTRPLRLHRADADPGAGDRPADGGPRHPRHRPDRHRQDRGLRAADPPPAPRPRHPADAEDLPGARARADARARRADRGGLPHPRRRGAALDAAHPRRHVAQRPGAGDGAGRRRRRRHAGPARPT